MKLTFLGANHQVTGSRTLLEWNKGRYLLVDDGMIQGTNEYENTPLPVSPSQIEYVFLTHAHIDHSGMLPLLVKEGFHGKIYATSETMNLCSIMLEDSASIQERDAEDRTKKNLRKGGEPVEPFYTSEDVQKTMKLFRPCPYGQMIDVDEGLTVRFTDAGHLLGSASVECFLFEEGKRVTMVFSGDVGNTNQPIIRDPDHVRAADYMMVESTYGARLHDRAIDPIPGLVEVLRKTFSRGGTVIIPSFAVGRMQEMLYFFREIKMKNLLPEKPDFEVYLDSPLAEQATSIFLQCTIDCLDEEAIAIMKEGKNPIWFDGLNITETVNDSMALNAMKKPKVILASGGMCEGGRICHHLKHNIWDPSNTILFVGYQANGTLGRLIYDGAEKVKILGEEIDVKAEIAFLNGISGHADQEGLLNWLDGMEQKPACVFINHGDDENSQTLSEKIAERFGIQAEVPWSGSCFDLLRGEWVHLSAPVKKVEKKAPAAQEKKQRSSDNPYYLSLLEAAADLQKYAENMKGHANHDIRKLTKQIRDLMEENDPKE